MLLGELAITTPVSLMLPADATEQTWLAVGHALAQRDSTTSWWWGDWWLAARPEWGDRAAFFEDPTWNGPAYSTIRHCMATCRWFEIGRRRPELTFSHHAELAGHMFPRAKCEKLLDWCVAGPRRASVRQLREEIERRRNGRAQRADQAREHELPKGDPYSRAIHKAIDAAVAVHGDAAVMALLRYRVEAFERGALDDAA
jgi:hypothetical protein